VSIVLRRAFLAAKTRLAANGRTGLALSRLFALEMHATLAWVFIYCAALATLGLIGFEALNSRTIVANVPSWIETAAPPLRGATGL
jgi:hypothetical protein